MKKEDTPKTPRSGPSARIILDSISEWGHRLTTMEVVMHRFVLAEFNTHRMFSRNSASSRAIPVSKIVDRVAWEPAFPLYWGRKQKGMQPGTELLEEPLSNCKAIWQTCVHNALHWANNLDAFGLHKSLVNRILEPFMWHTVIVSATEWDNFFWQRCDKLAQPEMKAAADAMQIAYYQSTPTLLSHGEWHTPFIRPDDLPDIANLLISSEASSRTEMKIERTTDYIPGQLEIIEAEKAISTARVARASYLTHEGIRDIREDLKLYNGTLRPGIHMSPFEQIATPVNPKYTHIDQCGNFVGWKQHRKEIRDENRKNFLPNLPELAQQRMRMQSGLAPYTGVPKNRY